MRIKASDVARVCGGTVIGPDREADGVGFDTRELVPGQAFVAIVADRDGHDHLAAAASAKAPFAIVARGRAIAALTCVEVDDTIAALASLARECRSRLTCPVIGITGSTGKTSTKNLVAAVLSTSIPRVHAAIASLNNDIGVPVTIINAPEDAGALVLEMGMRGFGEIARLCGIARPTVGVVTNVGDAHGDRVGGREGIARAKSELVAAIGADGSVVLNVDDDKVAEMVNLTEGHLCSVGRTPGCTVTWEPRVTDSHGRVTFVVAVDGIEMECTPSLPGLHMAANAALAVGVATVLGLDVNTAGRGIGTETDERGRMVWRATKDGVRVLDDSYNANVASMVAALDTIAAVGAQRAVAVLGRMAEVADEEGSHRRVADHARSLGITVVGLETDLYGVPAQSVDEVVAAVRDAGADVVLVKGSRSAATERAVAALVS